jgi:hypothetical protein
MFGSAARMLMVLSVVLLSACSKQEGGGYIQRSPAQSATTPLPPPPPPPTPTTPAPTPPSAASSDNLVKPVLDCYREIINALASVRDEQTARAAAPIVGHAADRLKPAMERLATAVKAAMATGTPLRGGDNTDDAAQTYAKMQDEIGRVYHSPAGQYIKPELNRVLNVLVETAFAGDRDRVLRWIEQQKLNQ